jgi:hypothetical protein
VIHLGEDALEPLEPVATISRLDRPRAAAPDAPTQARRLISFKDPDGAYLAAAALRRYLDATVVRDAVLVPTDRGPGLQIPADAAKLQLVRAIVVRFGGTIGPVE